MRDLQFLKCREGNFGLFAAILLPVLFGAAGLAIDFSQALLLRHDLHDAADAALLGNLSQNSKIMTAALATAGDGQFDAPTDEVSALFDANASDNSVASSIEIDSIVAEKREGVLYATMTYHATLPTTLSRFLGKQSITVSNISKVAVPIPRYHDYYVLLDNSPSMGVAATPSDVEKMIMKTPGKCQFACHTTETTEENNYDIARANNIRLRIDLLHAAAAQMIETAQKRRFYPSQYRFSVYNFGDSITTKSLNMILPMSVPSQSLFDDVQNLELMTLRRHGENNHAGTDLYKRISELAKTMGAQGTGYSPGVAIKTMIVVTDGVEASKKENCTRRRDGALCMEPLDNRVCDDAKRNGLNIAILYTTYLPLDNDNYWKTWIRPFQSDIGPKLQSCATNGMYVEASFEADLGAAMSTLFEKTLGGSRLTQ